MLICNLSGKKFNYEFEKLARLFLPFERIDVVNEDISGERRAVCFESAVHGGTALTAQLELDGRKAVESDLISDADSEKEKELKLSVCLFKCFVKITGYRPAWGILTGVRPARLFSSLKETLGAEGAGQAFLNRYLVSEEKLRLCETATENEQRIISLSTPDSFSLYISIPFCPTRCSYCSFVSHSVKDAAKLIPDYIEYLCRELRITGEIAKKNGLKLKTIYMGGGTPTSLTAGQLKTVFDAVKANFDTEGLLEYTVEAGRPDTVTEEKLLCIKQAGATRISINPQTMCDSVLENIGRKHTAKQVTDAFYLARKCGFSNINMDIIAGLPGDDAEGFRHTADTLISFDPESITVHALSVKRAADLAVSGEFPQFSAGNTAAEDISYAANTFRSAGYAPYYTYRQSKTVGNLENVGYAKPGFEGLYNVYTMDETHTILAAGAAAVTKLCAADGKIIERIFNCKYPYEYISRFDEQIAKKGRVFEFYEENFGRD